MIYNLSNPLDQEKFKTRCNYLYSNGKEVELIEKKVKNISEEDKRSIRQNNTFHLWISVISDEIGYISKDDCKRDIKRIILGMKSCENHITGKIEKEDYKTSQMSINEMRNFLEKLKIWAQQELGCYLPFYGDPGYDDMKKHYKNR